MPDDDTFTGERGSTSRMSMRLNSARGLDPTELSAFCSFFPEDVDKPAGRRHGRCAVTADSYATWCWGKATREKSTSNRRRRWLSLIHI